MSVALYIVLERKILGFDHQVNGNALGRASKLLDVLAERAGTRSLMQFFSASPEEISEFAVSHGQAAEESVTVFPPERWFSAEEGLMAVQRLREAARTEGIDNLEKIVADLDEFERVLNRAREHGVGWHLAVDY
ncbi:MAG TPA: hypothetical protein VK525_21475 [Candidatus Saccharimonadales bacterium]|nr:hypothetical protein [Candidatus Saccharimonadales bacterium]